MPLSARRILLLAFFVGSLSAVAHAGKFEDLLQEHKGTMIEFSVGFVGGSAVSSITKTATKFGLVVRRT